MKISVELIYFLQALQVKSEIRNRILSSASKQNSTLYA